MNDLETEFPILRELIFFDHAGIAPLSARASAAMSAYAQQARSRAYLDSEWYSQVEQVRNMATELLHARGAHEIAFVPNTSSGLSLIAQGLDWQPGDQVVTTNVEFPANRYSWEDLKRFGVELIEVPQLPDGTIDVDDVFDAITDHTRMVALSHVQYASGFCIDLKLASDMVHQAGGYICVDGIQSLGAMPVDVQELGVDFLAADGHKWLLSPEGCAILYVHEDLVEMLHPVLVGWMSMINATDYGRYQFQFKTDASRFEPGSYNVPGILALGASMELLLEIGMDCVWARIDALTTRLCKGLQAKGYPIVSPRGSGQRSGIVIFESPETGPSAPRIVKDLQEQGIVIVIREGRLRASPHFYNTEEQVDTLIEALP